MAEATLKRAMAEQATGIGQRGALVFYLRGGIKVDDKEAAKAVAEGSTVEVPGAGAGSYREVAERLGLEVDDLYNSTSSAGDWVISLTCGRFMFQTNRYPYYGFAYSVGNDA